MARPAPKPRGNFKSADFYAAFSKTLRNAPPPTPAAAAAAAAASETNHTVPIAVSGGNHVYPSPAHATPAPLAVPAATAARQSGDGRAVASRSAPVETPVPKPTTAPPPAPTPVKVEPKPTPVVAPAPAAPTANTAHLEAEIMTLREALRRKDDDLVRARAESSKRAAELEELKTAKTELERERNNLYKRVGVVEKKLERGTHHKDGQKRHDRSQIAVAVRSPRLLVLQVHGSHRSSCTTSAAIPRSSSSSSRKVTSSRSRRRTSRVRRADPIWNRA